MDQMLHVSSNPHVRDKMTTSKIMQLVVLALLPTTLFGIYNSVSYTHLLQRIRFLPQSFW